MKNKRTGWSSSNERDVAEAWIMLDEAYERSKGGPGVDPDVLATRTSDDARALARKLISGK